MKKILAMVLVGVIGMSVFTGCGKSEEEKAYDEVAQHLRDEAAADGVDIDKMLEEDAAKYNAEIEAGNQAIYDRNAFVEQLKNNEMVVLKEQYEIYSNATDSETAKQAGEEFNKAFDEYLEAAIGEYISDEYVATEHLRQNDIRKTKLTDDEIQTREIYLDNCYGKDYGHINLYKNENNVICILMWNDGNETMTDLKLVYPDGREVVPDLSTIDMQINSAQFIVKENSLILTDYIWAYEFTTDSSMGNSIANADGSPIFPEEDYRYYAELWENTIEDYNKRIQ